MIGRLRGILVERSADGVIVECGGVGYQAAVSLATLAALPEVGGEATLRVYTQMQENRIALYGFATAEERELFDRLITVKNVGPATALEILSAAGSPVALARAVAAGDVTALTRLRGIGKKRAELLVVELREKCDQLLASWGSPEAPAAPAHPGEPERSPMIDDVVSALVNLGWRRPEVERVVARLEVPDGTTIEALLREALQAMHLAANPGRAP